MPSGIRLIRTLCCRSRRLILILAFGSLVAGAAIQMYELAGQRKNTLTKNRLKAVGLALHSYHDIYGVYPPSVTEGPGGRPWHSWRTLIVPYLPEPPAFDYRFTEPWDSQHNLAAAKDVGHRFQSADRNLRAGETNFVAPTGRRSIWQGPHPMSHDDHYGGTTNHVAVIAHPSSPANLFTKPGDISTHEAVRLLAPERRESKTTASHWCLCADGSPHSLSASVDRRIAIRWLIHTKEATPIDRWPSYLQCDAPIADPETDESYRVSETDSLEVLATAHDSFNASVSTVWCATFEHAWSVAEREFGMPIRCLGSVPLCEQLSAAAAEPSALTKDDVKTRVARDESRLRIDVQSELSKSMPFRDVYESIDEPLGFHGADDVDMVQSFGFLSGTPVDRDPVFQEQLEVRFYRSPTRHAVELVTDGARGDRLLLARLEPGPTLWDTWESARSLQNRTPRELRRMDHLQIPKFAFELKKSFDDLVNQPLLGATEWSLGTADQTLRFQLNERGADLYSHVKIELIGSLGGEEAPPPDLPRELIYDGPFLLAATEEGRQRPYLLMWIADSTLLVEAE